MGCISLGKSYIKIASLSDAFDRIHDNSYLRLVVHLLQIGREIVTFLNRLLSFSQDAINSAQLSSSVKET